MSRSCRSSEFSAKRKVCSAASAVLIVLLIITAAASAYAYDGDAASAPDGAAAAITPEEASALTGIEASKLQVVWNSYYTAESYPLTLKLDLSGLDGLPVYVFEQIDGVWTLVTVGTAPRVGIPVERGGSFSAVTTTVGSNYPAKDTTKKAPGTGDAAWLFATAGVTAAGIVFALASTRKK